MMRPVGLLNRGRLTAVATSATVVAALALAGCADSEGSSGGGTTSLSTADQEQLEALYEGTSVSPATEAPAPQPGKNIWIISVGQAVDLAVEVTEGAADAAEAIGWTTKIFDGQFQPNVALQGVQQAVAAGADGIILYGIDCETVKTGVKEAKDAGIPVVGAQSKDCEDSLITSLSYEPVLGSVEDLAASYGEAQALWLISKSAPDAKFLELTQSDVASVKVGSESFRDTLKSACPDCTSVPIEFTSPDIGPALQQKVEQALLQHPDASGLVAPYSALFSSGVSAAVMASGRSDELNVIGGAGTEPNFDLIREDRGQDADIAYPNRWEGFAAVDWMNRLLNGETPTGENAPVGIGFQLVDADHNLPESGPVPATVDFEDTYLKAWGVQK